MTVHTSTDLHFVYMKPFINREIFNNYREKKNRVSLRCYFNTCLMFLKLRSNVRNVVIFTHSDIFTNIILIFSWSGLFVGL